MFEKLNDLEKHLEEVVYQLQNPDLSTEELRALSKKHSDLQEIVGVYKQYKKAQEEIKFSKELLQDKETELRDEAKKELNILEPKLAKMGAELQILLLPKDTNDNKNVILEIRGGAGGDEAALFVTDLFRMYQRYADKYSWKIEVLGTSTIGIGGIKEIAALISGKGVYSRMKMEAGVHRVQRVPETESQGRVHTSTVTVAIMPEADEIDIKLNPADLRIEVFRASGAGGQHVNTTDSAVRITHLPTKITVSIQDEKSQHKNKDKALKILRARILEAEEKKAHEKEASLRKSMVGTGDRSERIRTYNFPQGRITDHRIGLTIHSLDAVINGDLDQVVDPLITHYQAQLLKQKESNE